MEEKLYFPDPEPAYLRILKRVKEHLKPEDLSTFCYSLSYEMDRLIDDIKGMLNSGDFKVAKYATNELYELSRIMELMCERKK